MGGQNPPPRRPYTPKVYPKQPTIKPANSDGGAAKIAATTASTTTTLPDAAMAAVSALAAVSVPTATTSDDKDGMSDKGSEKAENMRANKAAHKKEKMTCYHCGLSGHFVIDCTRCYVTYVRCFWALNEW